MKIIIALLFITLLVLTGCKDNIEKECTQDSDCIAASCCHPTSCTTKEQAPDCSGVYCTMECQPNTLDCGGSCICENNKCKAEIE